MSLRHPNARQGPRLAAFVFSSPEACTLPGQSANVQVRAPLSAWIAAARREPLLQPGALPPPLPPPPLPTARARPLPPPLLRAGLRAGASMAAHLRECATLDRAIRRESQTRTIFDPEVRRLRAQLRSACEAALLADFRLAQVRARVRRCSAGPNRAAAGWLARPGAAHNVASLLCKAAVCLPSKAASLHVHHPLPSRWLQKHDVESLLWKAVFYRPIEEFRRRLKAAAEGELRDKASLWRGKENTSCKRNPQTLNKSSGTGRRAAVLVCVCVILLLRWGPSCWLAGGALQPGSPSRLRLPACTPSHAAALPAPHTARSLPACRPSWRFWRSCTRPRPSTFSWACGCSRCWATQACPRVRGGGCCTNSPRTVMLTTVVSVACWCGGPWGGWCARALAAHMLLPSRAAQP